MSNSDLLTRAVAKVIPAELAKEKIASGKKLRVYWGIDPTRNKLHIGHTIPMRKLQAFADAGHHAILLIGSFTAMLGDPSDKEAMRQPLTREEVEKNLETYKEQVSKIINFANIEIVYNHEWLEKLTYNEISQHASCFTLQQIQQRDHFERRMKAGKDVGLHEILYPLMVGYDSVFLDVDCEIGGTDQEFNMLAGRTMQKRLGKREKFVLTTPLIAGIDGRLMSKTYDNCIYITDAPNEMYGKLMSINDELIEKYFECCTDVPLNDISKIMNKGPRDSKAELAREIVKMYHSEEAAVSAEKHFTTVHKDKGVPEDVTEVKVKEGSALIDVLVEHELASSKSEAKRLIEQGGVKINNVVVKTVDAVVKEGIVKVGKRKFLSVKVR